MEASLEDFKSWTYRGLNPGLVLPPLPILEENWATISMTHEEIITIYVHAFYSLGKAWLGWQFRMLSDFMCMYNFLLFCMLGIKGKIPKVMLALDFFFLVRVSSWLMSYVADPQRIVCIFRTWSLFLGILKSNTCWTLLSNYLLFWCFSSFKKSYLPTMRSLKSAYLCACPLFPPSF